MARDWTREEDVARIRLVRGRDLVEHRLCELNGILTGMRLAREPDAGLGNLQAWIESHEEIWETWPVGPLRESLALHTQGEVERRETLQAIGVWAPGLERHVRAWTLTPKAEFEKAPRIRFKGMRMVFSGVFTGCRKEQAEAASHLLGALVRRQVARVTDWLVVGNRCHPGWKGSRRGRKIEAVERWRASGESACRIVREDDWADAVIAQVGRT